MQHTTPPPPHPACCPHPAHRYVFRIGMPPAVRIELISKMAAIEHRLAYGTSDKLQLGALCGAFAGGCEFFLRGGGREGGARAEKRRQLCADGVSTALQAHIYVPGFPCAAEAKEGIVAAAK